MARQVTINLGCNRGEVTVAVGGDDQHSTVSWPQCGEHFTLDYFETDTGTSRHFDMVVPLRAPDALSEALKTIREVLEANGVDQQEGHLSVSVRSGNYM